MGNIPFLQLRGHLHAEDPYGVQIGEDQIQVCVLMSDVGTHKQRAESRERHRDRPLMLMISGSRFRGSKKCCTDEMKKKRNTNICHSHMQVHVQM